MSAIVCGKRSSSVFEELLHTPPTASSKRARCFVGASPPTAAFRLSPTRNSPSSDRNDSGPLVAHLRSLFPEMDQQILERALGASGNDLESAIRSLNDLRLESTECTLESVVSKPETGTDVNIQLSVEGITSNVVETSTVGRPVADGLPQDGPEWVELFVREMMNASDVDDARSRASRVMEVLEKSIVARAGAEAMQNFHKENTILKEQVEVLLRENTILKRAVSIQHDRQKEYDEKNQELQHLKQMVAQYQEQLRTLEVNNYALTVHLRQAQQSSSLPGRFHPDVF